MKAMEQLRHLFNLAFYDGVYKYIKKYRKVDTNVQKATKIKCVRCTHKLSVVGPCLHAKKHSPI